MSDNIIIGDVRPRTQLVANGTLTEFVFPFPIFEEGDLKVYLDDQLQISGYTIANAGQSNGGSVIFTTAPDNGVIVTLVRQLTMQRTSDFAEGGAFHARVINRELDEIVAAQQQLNVELGRTIQLSPSENDADLVIPKSSERGNRVLAFDQNGDLIAGPTMDEVSNAQSFSQAAQNSAANALSRTGVWNFQSFLDGVDFTKGISSSLTLPDDPISENMTLVFFDSVFQPPDLFSLSGHTLQFTAAIPATKVDVIFIVGEVSAFKGIVDNSTVKVLELSDVNNRAIWGFGTNYWHVRSVDNGRMELRGGNTIATGGYVQLYGDQATGGVANSVVIGFGSTEMFVVDAVNNQIRSLAPTVFENGALSGATASTLANSVVVDRNTLAGMSILTPNNLTGSLFFGDPESNQSGAIQYGHGSDTMTFRANNTAFARGISTGLEAPLGVFLGGTAAANNLDDYEEGDKGSFTITVADAATGGNTSVPSQNNYYTKIGNIVIAEIHLENIDRTGFSTGNAMFFRGLPFASHTGTPVPVFGVGSVITSHLNFSSNIAPMVQPGQNYFRLASSGSVDFVFNPVGHFTNGLAGIHATIVYRVA